MIKAKWEQLSARDQRILKIGGIALGILFLLRFIWWPLYDRVGTLKHEIEQEESLSSWMSPRVAKLMEAKASGMSSISDKSLPAVEKSLQEIGLKPYVTQLSQNAQSQISITFADVPFEASMEWLERAQRQGWVVQSMQATKGEKTGMVALQFVLG